MPSLEASLLVISLFAVEELELVEAEVEVVTQVLDRGNKSLVGRAYRAEGLRFLPGLQIGVGTETADSVEVGEV